MTEVGHPTLAALRKSSTVELSGIVTENEFSVDTLKVTLIFGWEVCGKSERYDWDYIIGRSMPTGGKAISRIYKEKLAFFLETEGVGMYCFFIFSKGVGLGLWQSRVWRFVVGRLNLRARRCNDKVVCGEKKYDCGKFIELC